MEFQLWLSTLRQGCVQGVGDAAPLSGCLLLQACMFLRRCCCCAGLPPGSLQMNDYLLQGNFPVAQVYFPLLHSSHKLTHPPSPHCGSPTLKQSSDVLS